MEGTNLVVSFMLFFSNLKEINHYIKLWQCSSFSLKGTLIVLSGPNLSAGRPLLWNAVLWTLPGCCCLEIRADKTLRRCGSLIFLHEKQITCLSLKDT